jgi:hypothetical protein
MVVTRLYFEIPEQASGASTHYTIDLARELSKFHRRLVRQKQLFTVFGGLYQDATGSNAYIATAPHYWVTKRAINRGFKAWKKQISEAMSNVADVSGSPLRSGKWSDFKVHLGPSTGTLHLDAKDAAFQDLPGGEWNYTTVTMPRDDAEDVTEIGYISQPSDQFEMHIVGPHESTTGANGLNYSRVGLIKSWLDSRPIPNSLPEDGSAGNPDNRAVTLTDPLYKMFLTGDADEDEKIIEAINTENDFPPYDTDKVWGNAVNTTNGQTNLQMQCLISPDTNTGVASVAGFQALCGLVRITVNGATGTNGAALILDVESNGVSF